MAGGTRAGRAGLKMTDERIKAVLSGDDYNLFLAMRDVVDEKCSINFVAKKYEINAAVISTAVRVASMCEILEEAEKAEQKTTSEHTLNTLFSRLFSRFIL